MGLLPNVSGLGVPVWVLCLKKKKRVGKLQNMLSENPYVQNSVYSLLPSCKNRRGQICISLCVCMKYQGKDPWNSIYCLPLEIGTG